MIRLSTAIATSLMFYSLNVTATPVSPEGLLGRYEMSLDDEIALTATVEASKFSVTIEATFFTPEVACSGTWALDGNEFTGRFQCPDIDDVWGAPITSQDTVTLRMHLDEVTMESLTSEDGVDVPVDAQMKDSDKPKSKRIWMRKIDERVE
jgi:hypothetical protein